MFEHHATSFSLFSICLFPLQPNISLTASIQEEKALNQSESGNSSKTPSPSPISASTTSIQLVIHLAYPRPPLHSRIASHCLVYLLWYLTSNPGPNDVSVLQLQLSLIHTPSRVPTVTDLQYSSALGQNSHGYRPVRLKAILSPIPLFQSILVVKP